MTKAVCGIQPHNTISDRSFSYHDGIMENTYQEKFHRKCNWITFISYADAFTDP